VICERAGMVNVANTCTQAAGYIETLERKRKIPSPELGSDHEQVDCSDPATCSICNAHPTREQP
jgi:hypothetical protein